MLLWVGKVLILFTGLIRLDGVVFKAAKAKAVNFDGVSAVSGLILQDFLVQYLYR